MYGNIAIEKLQLAVIILLDFCVHPTEELTDF